ncbi:MAG TPA: hypothetical protein VEL47_07220, partial [Myxococcota bacterium]|nr:hypothetical protein [Myxococcota bacterium]
QISSVPALAGLVWPNSEPNKPTIALPIAYLAYSDSQREHYLEVMPAAPGKMLCDIINDYKSAAEKPDIARSYRQLGLELANFHNLMVGPGTDSKKLLKDSIIHGDLKCVNIFYDAAMNHFTLIDNEGMSHFLDRPGPRIADIAKLLFGHFVPGEDARVINTVSGLDLKQWYELAAKNFFLGYVEAFPKDQQREALTELRDIINGPIPGYNQAGLNDVRIKYINPIFDELLQKF